MAEARSTTGADGDLLSASAGTRAADESLDLRKSEGQPRAGRQPSGKAKDTQQRWRRPEGHRGHKPTTLWGRARASGPDDGGQGVQS